MTPGIQQIHTSFLRAAARSHLRERGLSYRLAAPLLGVHFTHLHYVMSGKRDSVSLLEKILRLPSATESLPGPTHFLRLSNS